MAKITGFVQKIFGKDAANIGQVGSAAAGTKVLTTNPTTIQALTAFTNGISDVTLSSKRIIPQEELMALHYLHSMANAYQQQEGVQEYNSGVTYFQKSIVKKAGTYELYGSLVDENIGNALTDGTKWVLLLDLSSSGFVYSLGASGYIKFPFGLMIQWGMTADFAADNTFYTTTFPIAFTTTGYGVLLTDQANDVNAAVGKVMDFVGSPPTGFRASQDQTAGSATNHKYFYVAFGR